MKDNTIAICHGQNCRDVGGKDLAEKLKSLSIDFEITPCQSLCSYAPTAKINNRAILRADLDTLLDA
jgi:NADH:ubiquinone oxidoreductase subunit E